MRYIDYYEKNEIIPVRQNLTDLERHFRRRDGLYRQLGLTPGWFSRKKIIEFGPGTGDNAVHIASKKPSLYTLVDANQYSVDSVREKISQGLIRLENVEVVKSNLIDYADTRRYDVVLCEGMLDGQDDSARYLKKAASFVGDNGVIVATTSDYVSMFADICRRITKPVFAERHDTDTLLPALVSFFMPDFNAVPGMSKLPEDWVLDSVLHPWYKDMFFPFPDAVKALAGRFDVQGASPGFFTDWRWYKDIVDEHPGFYRNALASYYQNLPAFIDYRVAPEKPCGEVDTHHLYDTCKEIYFMHLEIWDGDTSLIPPFLTQVGVVADLIMDCMPSSAKSVLDYIAGVEKLMAGDEHADFGSFLGMFGRAQQYVSFILLTP